MYNNASFLRNPNLQTLGPRRKETASHLSRKAKEQSRMLLCDGKDESGAEDDNDWEPQTKRKKLSSKEKKSSKRASMFSTKESGPSSFSAGETTKDPQTSKENGPAYKDARRRIKHTAEAESYLWISDDLLYCLECSRDYDGDCPEHGALNVIEDVNVPADVNDVCRAKKTLPKQISVTDSAISELGSGVWAKETIPARTRFGPYEGKVVPPEAGTSNAWLIRKKGKPDHCVDATELGLANWMRYVNCATHEGERNLHPFQYKGKIYYVTTCEISPQEELLVWCGDHDLPQSSVKTSKGIKANSSKDTLFQCPACRNVYSSQLLLYIHQKLCLRLRTVEQDDQPNGHAGDFSDKQRSKQETPVLANSIKTEDGNSSDYFLEGQEVTVSEKPSLLETSFLIDAIKKEDCDSVECFPEEELNDDVENDMLDFKLSDNVNDIPDIKLYQEVRVVLYDIHKYPNMLSESVLGIRTKVKRSNDGVGDPASNQLVSKAQVMPCAVKTAEETVERSGGEKEEIDDISYLPEYQMLQKAQVEHDCNPEDSLSNGRLLGIKEEVALDDDIVGDHAENDSLQETQIVLCDIKEEDGEFVSVTDVSEQQSFVCTLCDECFRNESLLTSHLLTHSGENSLVCSVCNELFFDAETLGDHEKMHCASSEEESEKSFQQKSPTDLQETAARAVLLVNPSVALTCEMCTETFHSHQTFVKHLTRRCNLRCIQCNVRLINQRALLVHLRSHSVASSKPKTVVRVGNSARGTRTSKFVCLFCKESFGNNDDLSDHLWTHSHTFVCGVCDKRFVVHQRLKDHVEEHTFPYACNVCSKRFLTKELLQEHERTHVNPFCCNVCNAHFAVKEEFESHLLGHTPAASTNANASVTNGGNLENYIRMKTHTFVCIVCKERFPDHHGLDSHLQIHFTPFECTVCHERFALREKLNKHQIMHSHAFRCNGCNESFANRSELLDHLDMHLGFLCNVCHKMFSSLELLNKHASLHTEKKNAVCTVCNKQFRKLEELERHFRIHKTREQRKNFWKSNPHLLRVSGRKKSKGSQRNMTL